MIRSAQKHAQRRFRSAPGLRGVAALAAAAALVAAGLLTGAAPASAGVSETWSPADSISNSGSAADQQQMVSDGTYVSAVWVATGGYVEAAASNSSGTTWSSASMFGFNATRLLGLALSGSTIMAVWETTSGAIESATSVVGVNVWTSAGFAGPMSGSQNDLVDASLIAGSQDREFVLMESYIDADKAFHNASYTFDGAQWNDPVSLDNGTENDTVPIVALGDDVVSVMAQDGSGTSSGLYESTSENNGLDWSTPTRIESGQLTPLQLVVDGNYLVLSWTDASGAVWTSAYETGSWTTPVQLATGNPDAVQIVADGSTPAGALTATWLTDESDGEGSLVESTSSDDGRNWTTPVPLASGVSTTPGTVALAAADDVVRAAWMEDADGDGSFDAEVDSSWDDGADWDGPTALGSASELGTTSLAVTGPTAVVAWTDSSSGFDSVDTSASTQSTTAPPTAVQPNVTAQASEPFGAAGDSVSNSLTVGFTGSWPEYEADGVANPVPVAVTSDLWGPLSTAPTEGSTVPPNTAQVCEVVTTFTSASSDVDSTSCSLPSQPGYYIWTERVDVSNTPQDEGQSELLAQQGDFGVPTEVIVEQWQPSVTTSASATRVVAGSCVQGVVAVAGMDPSDPNRDNDSGVEVELWGPFPTAPALNTTIDTTGTPASSQSTGIPYVGDQSFTLMCDNPETPGYYVYTSQLQTFDPNMLPAQDDTVTAADTVDVTPAAVPPPQPPPHTTPPAPITSPLAFTGTDATPAVTLGVGLLGAGLAVFGVVVIRRSRRRRRSGSTPARP